MLGDGLVGQSISTNDFGIDSIDKLVHQLSMTRIELLIWLEQIM